MNTRTWLGRIRSGYRRLLINYHGKLLDRCQRCPICQKFNTTKVKFSEFYLLNILGLCDHVEFIPSSNGWKLANIKVDNQKPMIENSYNNEAVEYWTKLAQARGTLYQIKRFLEKSSEEKTIDILFDLNQTLKETKCQPPMFFNGFLGDKNENDIVNE